MSTDAEWEKWGARDPYYGVLTHEKFRTQNLTDESKAEFFALGRDHVNHVLSFCKGYLEPGFSPRRVLDFGCGVGRLVIPFATFGSEVVGVDVSISMLNEARLNCDAAGVGGRVRLVLSDDDLSAVEGDFDLLHSCIVLQHIEIDRGLRIFRSLLRRIRPGGLGAVHIAFAWRLYESNFGAPPPSAAVTLSWWRRLFLDLKEKLNPATPPSEKSSSSEDPEMQMNYYNLSQVMFLLYQAGVTDVYSQISDHGGALGVFMFFRVPA